MIRLLGSRGTRRPYGCKAPQRGAVPHGSGNLRLAAMGGQTALFRPFGPEPAAVCLLSQTPDRNGHPAAVPAAWPCSRVVGGGQGGCTPPGGRSRPQRGPWPATEGGGSRGTRLPTATGIPGTGIPGEEEHARVPGM